jgi:hypothetical protein
MDRHPFAGIRMVAVSLALGLGGGPAGAAETAVAGEGAPLTLPLPRLTIGAETDVQSRYLWRGLAVSKDAVTQSSMWLSSSDFTFTVWGNFVLGREPQRGRFNEVDLSLSHSRQWGKLTVEPGVQYYSYPNVRQAPGTGEASLTLSYPAGPVSLFTTQALDVARYGGAYFGEAGASAEWQPGKRTTVESSVRLGWGSSKFNRVYAGRGRSALNVASADVAVTYQAGAQVYIRPHVTFSTLLDGGLRRRTRDDDLISFGVAVGREF